MLEQTFVSQRTVCDSVADILETQSIPDKKAIEHIEISAEMLKYCRAARNRYRNYLDERKAIEKQVEDERNNGELKKMMESEQKKAQIFERDIKKLRDEADTLAVNAEKKGKLGLLAESNKKRKRVNDLTKELEATQNKIRKLNENMV